MTPVDLFKTFDKDAGEFALVATYEFDPVFFEGRLLKAKGFGAAPRIVVLMDRRRYADLIASGIEARDFNRRYLVIPVGRTAGVFHPKLYLVLGRKRVSGVIGSLNCTNAGIAHNLELCATFSVGIDATDPEAIVTRQTLRQIYEALRDYARDGDIDSEILENHYFGPIEDEYFWLNRKLQPVDHESGVTIFTSRGRPIWDSVVDHLEGKNVKRITVLSPFYDSDLTSLRQFASKWPDAGLEIIAQPNYSSLAADRLYTALDNGKTWRLLAATPARTGRRLHAKAIAFETESGTYWLMGSANATRYALQGINEEASIWIKTIDNFDAIVDPDLLKLTRIKPEEFVPGDHEAPGENDAVLDAGALRLRSVTLDQSGRIVVDMDPLSGISDLGIRLANINQSDPIISRKIIMSRKGTATFMIEDTDMALAERTVLCELAGEWEGKTVNSNQVSLVQLNRLLRNPAIGDTTRNPIKKIVETGDGLEKYVDSLGNVKDAVEFFKNTNIFFFDGEDHKSRFGPPVYRPRDPFKSDIPTAWGGLAMDDDAAALREAIREFVGRHQREKLERHVKRGNLNGLQNFLDIFRTLNRVLLEWHSRRANDGSPLMPHGMVTPPMRHNIGLLIGSEPGSEEGDIGFVDAIRVKLQGEDALIEERLLEMHVPVILVTAAKALIDVRAIALQKNKLDSWGEKKLDWVTGWIKENGLANPTEEEISRNASRISACGSGGLTNLLKAQREVLS